MKFIHIFLAEDNHADVILIKEALSVHGVAHTLSVVQDGEAAVRAIRQFTAGDTSTRPDLILLDLNLPRVDGVQVLQALRSSADTEEIPVIIITSSDAPRDHARVARLGVSRYFCKPTDLDAFLRLGAVIKEVMQDRAAGARDGGNQT